LWKTGLPVGKSSPVFVGDRIFLTASEGDDLITMCLSRATGKVLWRRSVRAAAREWQNALNDRAAPTAVTSEKSVFVFFADFGLVAYDFEGNEQWRLPLGPFNSQHGIVASPVYADGRVILVADQDTDAYIIGVDADRGEIVWKKPREVINGYSTPIVYRPARGPVQVIAPGSYQLTAYSVADGETLWYVRGLTCQPKSAPPIAGDVVFFNGWTPGTTRASRWNCPASPRSPPRPTPTATASWRRRNFRRRGSLREPGARSTWTGMVFSTRESGLSSARAARRATVCWP
jgi:outer membrane protein assembly factor BamB